MRLVTSTTTLEYSVARTCTTNVSCRAAHNAAHEPLVVVGMVLVGDADLLLRQRGLAGLVLRALRRMTGVEPWLVQGSIIALPH